MGWRSINDQFCGHSCSDGVMVPQKKPSYPTGDIMLDHVVKMVKEAYEVSCLMKKLHKIPLTHSWCFDGPCTLEDDDVVIIDLMKTWNP